MPTELMIRTNKRLIPRPEKVKWLKFPILIGLKGLKPGFYR